jgi:hypothetical protein
MVIELVGPAGVGKTTLSRQLEAGGHGVRGTMWSVPTPLLARSTLRQLPTAITLYRATGKFLWDEIKHLARLDALNSLVRTAHWTGRRLVVLDEGPVYAFSYLQVMGHPRFRDGPAPPFWYRTLQRWSRNLDAVVVLDAPDQVLTTRIRTRAQPHLVKDRGVDEVSAFSNAYRAATERVLTDLQAIGGPPVLRLDVGRGDDRLDERLRDALAQDIYAR